MSLLLDALKKAELAKQGALGTPQQDEELDIGGIRFEEPSEPTFHQDPIPQYQESAFERSADNGFTPEPEPEPAPVPAPAPEPIPVPAPRSVVRPSPPPERDAVSAPTPNPQRTAARQVFEAKEVDYNPKRPFYITLGALGLAAFGYGGYLWWQLQPKYSVNTATIQNAPKSSPISKPLAPPPEEPVATADADAAAKAPTAEGKPTAPATTTAATAESTPPITPAAPAAKAAAPAIAPQTGPTPPKAAATAIPSAIATAPSRAGRPGQPAATSPAPASAPATAAAPQSAPRAPRLPIKVTPPAFQGNQVLESAYAAFQRGELDRARTDYQQVLGREANNRDALLGLAAIDVRTRDYETAELRYLKLLELDPRDASAQAALISLQGNIDPVQTESRIKNLIATQPEATHLYFTLGNQYAAQKRWAEAQDAYFKAFSGDPENADFAFNLAISLDHLRQRRPAAEYYRKSLNLAGTRVVGFDRKVAETRARELER